MIKIYPAENRYYTQDGPVGKSYFTFSFNEYYDPNNTEFGDMRVLNDDFALPGGGIGMHPHSNMEIVSLILTGGWAHKDSAGNEEVTNAGEIQRMTAGSGIRHSEYNVSETGWSNGFQMWFEPDRRNLKPDYEKIKIDFAKTKNQLYAVVKKGGGEQVAHINQDMTIFLSNLDKGKEISYEQKKNRKIFFMVIEGAVKINGNKLKKRDSARITETDNLKIEALEDSYLMLIDLR